MRTREEILANMRKQVLETRTTEGQIAQMVNIQTEILLDIRELLSKPKEEK